MSEQASEIYARRIHRRYHLASAFISLQAPVSPNVWVSGSSKQLLSAPVSLRVAMDWPVKIDVVLPCSLI